VDDLPPVIRCSTITLLAHSMPGAGVVHHIIRDRVERPAMSAYALRPEFAAQGNVAMGQRSLVVQSAKKRMCVGER
jgi:hypothetical protein